MQMRDKNYIKLDNKAMVLFNGLFINYYLLMVFSLFNARLPCFMTFLKKKNRHDIGVWLCFHCY